MHTQPQTHVRLCINLWSCVYGLDSCPSLMFALHLLIQELHDMASSIVYISSQMELMARWIGNEYLKSALETWLYSQAINDWYGVFRWTQDDKTRCRNLTFLDMVLVRRKYFARPVPLFVLCVIELLELHRIRRCSYLKCYLARNRLKGPRDKPTLLYFSCLEWFIWKAI